MAEIPFRQYLLPNGRQKSVSIDRPDDIAEKAMQIITSGYRFECEFLTTGEVSFTIFDIEEEEDVAIQVTSNGPDVPKAVDRLVIGWYSFLKRAD